MQVVRPADWLALLVFALLIALGLGWAILGKVPVVLEGRAIFLQPRQGVPLQATVSGEIQRLHIKPGDCLQKRQLLATLTPTDLLRDLRFAQARLAEVESQIRQTQRVQGNNVRAERQAIAANRATLEQNLADARSLTPLLREKTLASFGEQQRSLTMQLEHTRRLVPLMAQRVAERRSLQNTGAISNDMLLEVQQDYLKVQENVVNLEAQLKALAVTQAEAEEKYRANLNQIQTFQAQLADLQLRQTAQDRQNLALTIQDERLQQELQRQIAQLKLQIASNSKLISTQSGCLTELNITTGQLITAGMPLGTVQTDTQTKQLQGISYLAVGEGKRIQPGMKLILTPDTVPRERFGGIMGTVQRVSPLPVTTAGVLATVGNADLVPTLTDHQGAVIEIVATLLGDRQTPSGYRWSASKGPSAPITAGTTATVRITVEERSPISFVLPFLQTLGDGQ